jgi:hypothetical protein
MEMELSLLGIYDDDSMYKTENKFSVHKRGMPMDPFRDNDP